MKNEYDQLNMKLEEIEEGSSGKAGAIRSKEEQDPLDSLVILASQIRQMDHPHMKPERIMQQKQEVMKAMVKQQKIHKGYQKSSPFTRKNLNAWILTSVSLLVLVVLLAAGAVGVSLWQKGLPSARVAVVEEVGGIVEVSLTDKPGDWRIAVGGEKLSGGATLRTYTDSTAVLVFYDGSRATINPETNLQLMQVNGIGLTGLQVEIAQDSGTTTHAVIPLRGEASYYQVHTPAGITTVHGTQFRVTVGAQGYELVEVQRGKVAVSGDQSQVFLTAGQATTLLPAAEPLPPAYQFTLRGSITRIEGALWTINGASFNVSSQAILTRSFMVGDMVEVKGRVLADGAWAADLVDGVNTDQPKNRFTGVVAGITPTSWTIGKQVIYLASETETPVGVKIGDTVQVMFNVLSDGRWLAKSIENPDEGEEDGQPAGIARGRKITPPGLAAKATPTVGSQLAQKTPQPSSTKAAAAPEGSAVPTLPSECTGGGNDKQHPEGLRLAERYGVPYEEIMGWFCQHNGFGEIDLAYSLSRETKKPVKDIFAMRQSGEGWGNIKKELQDEVVVSPTPKKPVKTEKPAPVKPVKTPPGKIKP